MTKASSIKTLEGILTLDSDTTDTATARQRSGAELPMLDERVDLFLRAVYGSEKNASSEDRALARKRILASLATELFEDVDDWAAASETNSAIAPLSGRLFDPARRARTSLIDVLRNALLFPLMWPIRDGMQARFITASLAAILITAGALGSGWLYTARSTQSAIVAWADSEAKAGRIYECRSRSIGGFPFRVEATCDEPNATIVYSERSSFVVSAKRITTVASLLQPGTLNTQFIGPFSVSESGQPVTFVGDWSLARAIVHGDATNLKQISVVLDGSKVYRGAQVGMQPLLVSERLEIDLQPKSTPTAGSRSYDVSLRIAGGAVPEGGPILSQSFSADINAVLRGDDRPTPHALIAQLQQWQATGGRVEVKTASVRQSGTDATLQGDLELAANGEIQGALSFTGGDLDRVANLLTNVASQGGKDQQAAASLPLDTNKTVSRSITRPYENPSLEQKKLDGPEKRRAKIPLETMPVISFSDRGVYFGSVLLGRIPPLY